MIRPTRDGRIRISRVALNKAGFSPGDTFSVIQNMDTNSVSIVSPRSVPKARKHIDYRVESDGRARISNTMLKSLGIRMRRKNPQCTVERRNITIIL